MILIYPRKDKPVISEGRLMEFTLSLQLTSGKKLEKIMKAFFFHFNIHIYIRNHLSVIIFILHYIIIQLLLFLHIYFFYQYI